MRLLNTDTLQLELFMSEEKPQYAILSHTWGDEEITFEDVERGRSHLLANPKMALRKVQESARIAREDNLAYIWIDTCCIDKSSSAELSEAINSMFDWYHGSAVCYAFLADYDYDLPSGGHGFAAARWFTRGWTLQELIAPQVVNFYDGKWTKFGTRERLAKRIADITLIDEFVLSRRDPGEREISVKQALDFCSTSKKMSWASRRITTRTEDIAYCLLGIFDINMPLLYGEGTRAFQRLQEHIAAATHDQTLICWQEDMLRHPVGVFALDPSAFKGSGRFRPVPHIAEIFFMSNTSVGLELDVYLTQCKIEPNRYESQDHFIAVLSCSDESDDFTCAGLLLHKTEFLRNSYARTFLDLPNILGTVLIRPDSGVASLPAGQEFLDENLEFMGRKIGKSSDST